MQEYETLKRLIAEAEDDIQKAEGGNKAAKHMIAMIKIVAPNMACTVIDRAMQMHGAVGLSQDTYLAAGYAYARTVRLADGPDQVHMMQLGRNLAKKYSENS